MASTWLTTRAAKDGSKRFRVEFRAGGREAPTQYEGSFKRKADAARRRWIVGELAALRVPDIRQVAQAAPATLRTVAEAWQRSRVDVAEGTAQTYRVALGRLLPRLGDTPVAAITSEAVAQLVADLHADGLKKQTIRKTISTLAMVLDHARVQPNPREGQADCADAEGGAADRSAADRGTRPGGRPTPTFPVPAPGVRARRDRNADLRACRAHLG